MSFALPHPLNDENYDTMEFAMDLGEYFQEMTEENLQPMGVKDKPQDDELVGESAFHSSPSGMEILNEDAIDEEVARGDERTNYAPWKVILMVGGAAVGLVALVGAIILVLKNIKKTGSADVQSSPSESNSDKK